MTKSLTNPCTNNPKYQKLVQIVSIGPTKLVSIVHLLHFKRYAASKTIYYSMLVMKCVDLDVLALNHPHLETKHPQKVQNRLRERNNKEFTFKLLFFF